MKKRHLLLLIGMSALLLINHNTQAAHISQVPVEGLEVDQPFFVETRSDKLTIQDCATCHNKPTGRSLPIESADRRAHWDIILEHADPSQMMCKTCHGQIVSKVPTMMSGDIVGFDHTYRLCGQCHFRELKDWSKGAHGKRLLGWSGPRIIRSCTGCHNPHSPRWAKRWPKTKTTIPSRNKGDAPYEE